MTLGNEFFRVVLDNLIEGVCAFDLQQRIIYWSRGAEAITGYEACDVLGRTCHDNVLVHLDVNGMPQCTQGCALRAAIASGECRSVDLFVLHKHGHRVPVLVRSAPLVDAGGRVIGAVQTFVENSAGIAAIDRIRELERMSYVDPLTELANRRYAEIMLRTRMDELQRYGWPFGVVMLDIDNLKDINDAHGHGAGDAVLRAVGQTLHSGSRPFDVKGRWGGDEFIAVLANVDGAGLEQAVRRLTSLVEQTRVRYEAIVLTTTVSAGAALARVQESVEQLVARADRLLYDSKQGGKNRSSVDRVL